jgi:hypothetical protein
MVASGPKLVFDQMAASVPEIMATTSYFCKIMQLRKKGTVEILYTS